MGKIIMIAEGSTVGTTAEGRGVRAEYEVSETDSARLIRAVAATYPDRLQILFGPPPYTIEQIITVFFNEFVFWGVRCTEEYERRTMPLPPISISGYVPIVPPSE